MHMAMEVAFVAYHILLLWRLCKEDSNTIKNKKPTELVGQAKRRTTKIRLKATGEGILAVFSNCEKCRPEVADYAISGVAVD